MINIKKIFSALLALIITLNTSSQGLGFNESKYSSYEEYEPSSLGFTPPSSQSLREYAPVVIEQKGMSCVGFATAYSALSIMHNYKLGIRQKSAKMFTAFDPYLVYSIITKSNDCNELTYMYDGLSALLNTGCKKLYIYPLLDCKSDLKKSDYLWSSNPYKLKNFYIVPKERLKDRSFIIEHLKTAVCAVAPPVIGIKTTNSMAGKGYGDGTVGSDGLWVPSYYDKEIGGHAVTIIGYDDNKFGGSFEIMNSWGNNFGDDGFMWVKYDDLLKVIDEAYLLEIHNGSQNSDVGCKLGNCYDGYSHSIFTNFIEEGMYSNGKSNGIVMRIMDKGSLMGFAKNGVIDGLAYFYSNEQKKFYKANYNMGELIDIEAVGFVEQKLSDDEIALDKYIRLKSEDHSIEIEETNDENFDMIKSFDIGKN